MLKRILSPFSRLSHTSVGLLLLSGLLFLRIPYLTLIAALFVPSPWWLFFSFAIGTYVLTAFLIWWERERLREFWFDLVSAIIFLCQNFMFPVGIGLFVTMFRRKARFPKPSFSLARWALTGALLAILVQIFFALNHINPPQQRAGGPATLAFLFSAVLIQMVNAAVWEEPLFRGFLWGYLRMARWKNVWIWLFQAGLFTLSHVYYLREEPFLTWLLRLMIPSLLLGLVAWRARSISASMVTHGFLNASGDLLMHFGTLDEAVQIAWTACFWVAAALLAASCIELLLRWKSRRLAGA